MARIVRPSPVCPLHGKPTKRATCRSCNAAYMREYMWRRRQEKPDRELWRRAKERAAARGLEFTLSPDEILIPPKCPALGIPLRLTGERSPYSPSLDRIDPFDGYVSGNVRVISDRANRLKGDRDATALRARAAKALPLLAAEYRKIAEYVERENLLKGVRFKAANGGRGAAEWTKIAEFLDRVFSRGQLVDDSGA